MFGFIKPIVFDVPAMQRRVGLSFPDTGGVKVLVFKCQIFEMLLGTEVFDMA